MLLTLVNFVVSRFTSLCRLPCTTDTFIVHSKRDYCNSLYYKLPKSLADPELSCSYCRESCSVLSYHSLLRSLLWLRITERIEYKLLSLTYKVLTTTQPPYLHNLISTSSQYSLLICRYSCSATFIVLSQNNLSLLSLCFILSLESTPSISSSTSVWYQFLHFLHPSLHPSSDLPCTLLIHYPLSLSLPA